jgi:pilus assembly protein CpaF
MYGGLTPSFPFFMLYSEMAEYSVLTKYLGRKDIEEVNVNGWDDIAVTYRNGITEKSDEHFLSPRHAEDIIKRLLHHPAEY